MNMKENVIFLRNEWTTTGEVDKTDRTELGKCIHLYDEKQGNKETSKKKKKGNFKHQRFRLKIVFVGCKKNK